MVEFETSSRTDTVTGTDSSPNLSKNDNFEASSPKRRRMMEKSKYSGAFMYKTKFSKEWTKTWPFISAVPGDPFIARSNVCAKSVTISHQGAADIRSHVRSQSHTEIAKAAATQSKLSFALPNPLAERVRKITNIN